jgi:hypothetical protein
MLRMIFEAVSSTTPQVQHLLEALKGEMSRAQLLNAVGLKDRKSFRERYIALALTAGLIEMMLPEKPNSPLQRYRLTDGRKPSL